MVRDRGLFSVEGRRLVTRLGSNPRKSQIVFQNYKYGYDTGVGPTLKFLPFEQGWDSGGGPGVYISSTSLIYTTK